MDVIAPGSKRTRIWVISLQMRLRGWGDGRPHRAGAAGPGTVAWGVRRSSGVRVGEIPGKEGVFSGGVV